MKSIIESYGVDDHADLCQKYDNVNQMFERYTTDVPATPDPDFVSINETPEISIEDRMLAVMNSTGDTSIRHMLEEMIEEKKPGPPKEEFDDSHHDFEKFNAQEFINSIAVYDSNGRLSLDGTSAKIGIPYTYAVSSSFVMGEIVGLMNSMPNEPLEIHLAKDHRKQHLQTTFGHEIGHYYWQNILYRGYEGEMRNTLEENFCDYFGRRMAMPQEGIKDFEVVNEKSMIGMMSKFGVDLNDLIPQLMNYEMLPGRVAIDTYKGQVYNPDFSQKVMRTIFCAHCAIVGCDYNCPDAGQKAPLFDFTDRAWADNFSTGCLGEDVRKPNIISTFTKYYVSKEAQLVLFRPGATYEYVD